MVWNWFSVKSLSVWGLSVMTKVMRNGSSLRGAVGGGEGGRGLECTWVGEVTARAVRNSKNKTESLIVEMGFKV